MRQLVVGLGNPILGDDGVGIHVARGVRDGLPACLEAATEVVEASIGGLRLAEMMLDFDSVIVIDSLVGGDRPGRIHEWSVEDLEACSATQHDACAHDTSLATALALCRDLGADLPGSIRIFAVETEPVDTFSEDLTPPVADAVERTVGRVLAHLVLTDTPYESVSS